MQSDRYLVLLQKKASGKSMTDEELKEMQALEQCGDLREDFFKKAGSGKI